MPLMNKWHNVLAQVLVGLVAADLVWADATTVDLSGWQAPAFKARDKKLVGFPWATPSPAYLRDHMADLERAAPYFDGIVFKLPDTKPGDWPPWLPAFDCRPWTERDVPLAILGQIRWNKFQHNFISMGPGPSYDEAVVSWFDDAAWETVQANLRLLSRAVKASGARGIFFDVENYSGLWHYWHKASLDENPARKICLYPGFTFAQVEEKVRQRGRQFITALQSEKPDLVLLATALLSSSGDSPEKVETSFFPLLRAFTVGMLEAAGPQVMFVDGTEGTYWANGSDAFLWWHKAVREGGLNILPENLRERWTRQSTSGMAVYYDGVANGLYTDKLPVDRAYRLRWLEHNVYYAMLTNDEWTWMFFEKANPWTGEGVPADAIAAIERGKAKALAGQPLGWTMVTQSLTEPVPSKVLHTPEFAITKPRPAARFPTGAEVQVEIAAANGVGLTYVQLYMDSIPLVGIAGPPFQAVLRNVPRGNHTLLAFGYFTGDCDRGLAAPVTFEVGLNE